MSSVNNQTIIDEYLLWYSENISESIETQKGARILRNQFLKVYGDKDLLAIDKADVLRYLNFVKNGKYIPAGKDKKNELKPYAPLTQFQKKSVVRGLLKWLHTSEDYNLPNLTSLIKLKKVKAENINHELLTYQDCEKLIESCVNQRDRAIISFLIDSGVRVGEFSTSPTRKQ
jgi:integrase